MDVSFSSSASRRARQQEIDKENNMHGRSRSVSRGTLRPCEDPADAVFDQERQSLLHCLSDTNRSMSRLMTEKDKLAERLSRTRDEHAKSSIALQAKAEAAAEEVMSLRQNLREKSIECETLQTAMFKAQGELADLTATSSLRISELEASVRHLRDREGSLSQEVEEYRRKLLGRGQDVFAREQELIRERELCEARMIRLQHKHTLLQKQVKDNRAQREAEDQLQTALAHIESLKSTIRSQGEELREYRVSAETSTSSAGRRINELEAEIGLLRRQLSHSEESSQEALGDAESLSHFLARLQQENTSLRAELQESKADITYLQEAGDAEILRQVKDAEARMAQDPKHSGVFQDLARERDELQATVVDLQRTVEEMQGLIESYHGDLEAISNEVTRLRSSVSTEKEARMRMEAHYKGRESLLSQEVSCLKELLARKDDELANTFGLASDLNRQREELVGLVQRLTASEEEHSKSVAELTQQVEQLQEEQELVKRERLELIEEIASHVDTIQLLSSERQAQAQLLDELTSRLHSSGGAPRSYSAMFSQHRASSASAGSAATPSPSSAGTRAPTPDGAFRPQSAVTASGQQRQKRTPSPVPSVRSYRSDRNPAAEKEEVDPMPTRAKLVIRNM